MNVLAWANGTITSIDRAWGSHRGLTPEVPERGLTPGGQSGVLTPGCQSGV